MAHTADPPATPTPDGSSASSASSEAREGSPSPPTQHILPLSPLDGPITSTPQASTSNGIVAGPPATQSGIWRIGTWLTPSKRSRSPPRSGIVQGSESPSAGLSDASEPLSATEDQSELPAVSVDDEGVSMTETTGKVDFITSLPLELSLYLLLFVEPQSICRAMQVSKGWNRLAGDPLIWREHFYGNQGWHLNPDWLKTVEETEAEVGDKDTSLHSTPKRATGNRSDEVSASGRSHRSGTNASENSIAARIGRRLGDIVSEMNIMGLGFARPTPAKGTPRVSVLTPTAGGVAAQSLSALLDADRERLNGTPSRSRANTSLSSTSAASTSASGANLLSTAAALTTPSRVSATGPGLSASTSNRRLSASTGSLRGGQAAELAVAAFEGNSRRQSIVSRAATPHGRSRSSTAGTLRTELDEPLALISEAEEEEEILNRKLRQLDWYSLYRDRHVLNTRWNDGKFVKKTFRGHRDSVYCIALKGNLLVSGSRDMTIKLWDIAAGDCIKTIEGHTASVLAVQVDLDMMVTGSSVGELFVWETDNWTQRKALTGHSSGVLDVGLNEHYIASCSKDTSVRIWRRDTLEPFRMLSGHRGPVNAIQLYQHSIVSASGDSIAKLWDIPSGKTLRALRGHGRGLACVQYNGEFILTGSNDQTIRIWDPDTGECVRTLEGHDDLVRTMCLDTIRRKVYSGSYDKTTRLWNIDAGELEITFQNTHASLVFDVQMDVSRIISCSHDRRIVMVDFGEGLDAHRFL